MSTSLAALVPYCGWRRSLLGLLAALALLVALPAGARAATVSVSTTGNDDTCAPGGGPCLTLARAVAVAADGDTVRVGPGRFNIAADVTFTKRLTYLGARAGVPASQRDLADLTDETVLHEADAPTTAVGALMMVQAAGVVVDGFVFSGNQNGWGLRTEGESGDIDYGGYRIVNNIFTGNRVGMYLRDGRDTVVSNNLFHDSGAPGSAEPNGHGIYADDSAINVTISDNEFRENAMSLSLVPGPGDDAANVSYSRNVSINDAHGVNFNGVDGLDIIDNRMRGGAEGAISLVGSGLDNVQVVGNRITEKGSYGINLNTYGASENGKVTIRENTILRTRAIGSGAGMAITLANNSISEPLTIVKNRIVDSATIGLRNRETTEVDARRNWWGCNLGPGTEGCDSVIAQDSGVTPAFAPWLTLSLSLRDTATPVPAGGSATLFARVANLSAGGLADGPFFRRAPARFASEPAGGTLNPVTTRLSTDEVTATSAFTAGPRPTEWSVTVDHQIVRLFNPDSPATPGSPANPDSPPCVVPKVVPSDTTLTPGQRVVITIGLVNRCTEVARGLRVCMRLSAKLNRSGKRCIRIASLQPGHTRILRVRARVRRGACRGRLAHRIRLQVAGQPPQVRRAVARLIARRCRRPAVTG